VVKLRKIKDKMFTETGKKLAEKRHNLMEAFFDELLDETWYNE
jgi:HD superfamily phosphodiesterase